MALRLSDLPKDLQRQVLDQIGETSAAPARRKPRAAAVKSRLMKVCPACRYEIFRPDGIYPERCDGCGGRWPAPPHSPLP